MWLFGVDAGVDGVQHADDVLTLVGEERGYLSLLGVLIPPLGGVLIGDLIARWRGELPALMTLTEEEWWRALVPYVLGSLSAWILNLCGIGIVVALVLA